MDGSEELRVSIPADVAGSLRFLTSLIAPPARPVEDVVVEVLRDYLGGLTASEPRRERARGPLDPDRVRAMHDRYVEGATLQEVGDEFGVTRERVRQLFVASGYSSRGRGERIELREQHDDERGAEIEALYRELGDVAEVADRIGWSTGRTRGVLLRRGVEIRAYRRRTSSRRPVFSDEEVLECLREASRDDSFVSSRGILTAPGYDRARRGRRTSDGRPWPSSQIAALRFGTWRAALEAAGVPANPSSGAAGRRRFDVEACVAALREAKATLGHLPTASEYQSFAVGRAVPSMATIRNRVGSWQAALRLAAD
jgi:hypothetical protein